MEMVVAECEDPTERVNNSLLWKCRVCSDTHCGKYTDQQNAEERIGDQHLTWQFCSILTTLQVTSGIIYSVRYSIYKIKMKTRPFEDGDRCGPMGKGPEDYNSTSCRSELIRCMWTALFWVITQRLVVNSLSTFRDKLSVPSSRVKWGR